LWSRVIIVIVIGDEGC